MIYLDYSANTPSDPAVLARFCCTESQFIGNPNSNHSAGRETKAALSQITESISSRLGVQSDEIIYTSGASESNNLGIKGISSHFVTAQ